MLKKLNGESVKIDKVKNDGLGFSNKQSVS